MPVGVAFGVQLVVEPEGQLVAHIPEPVARQALSTTAREFDLFTLDGRPTVHYGGDDIHFDPGSAALAILDPETGTQRVPLTADFVRLMKLVEQLPQIDAQSTSMICGDVAPEIGDLYRLYLALNYIRKPIVTGAFRKDTWWTMKEMLAATAGGDAPLAAKPIAVFDVCPSPPLLWSDLTCQNLIDCARAGIPAERQKQCRLLLCEIIPGLRWLANGYFVIYQVLYVYRERHGEPAIAEPRRLNQVRITLPQLSLLPQLFERLGLKFANVHVQVSQGEKVNDLAGRRTWQVGRITKRSKTQVHN